MRNATETVAAPRDGDARRARARARLALRVRARLRAPTCVGGAEGGAAHGEAPPTGLGRGRCLPAAPPPRGTHRGRARATRPHVSDVGLEPPTRVRHGSDAGGARVSPEAAPGTTSG